MKLISRAILYLALNSNEDFLLIHKFGRLEFGGAAVINSSSGAGKYYFALNRNISMLNLEKGDPGQNFPIMSHDRNKYLLICNNLVSFPNAFRLFSKQ